MLVYAMPHIKISSVVRATAGVQSQVTQSPKLRYRYVAIPFRSLLSAANRLAQVKPSRLNISHYFFVRQCLVANAASL